MLTLEERMELVGWFDAIGSYGIDDSLECVDFIVNSIEDIIPIIDKLRS